MRAPTCPECRTAGVRSTVQVAGNVRLKMGEISIASGSGRASVRGFQQVTRTYRCSKGHRWSETDRQPLAQPARGAR